MASKNIGDDDLYSKEDLTLNSLGGFSHDPVEVMFEKNIMRIIRE